MNPQHMRSLIQSRLLFRIRFGFVRRKPEISQRGCLLVRSGGLLVLVRLIRVVAFRLRIIRRRDCCRFAVLSSWRSRVRSLRKYGGCKEAIVEDAS